MFCTGYAKAAVYSKKSINEIPKKNSSDRPKKTNSAPDYLSERSSQNYSIGIFYRNTKLRFRIQFYFLKI